MNKNKNDFNRILVAGCGELGSRYIQGLSKVTEKLKVTAYDPSSQALAKAEKRLDEITDSNIHDFEFTNFLCNNKDEYDIAIVASTAKNRHNLVEKLQKYFKIKYWIIEKVVEQGIAEINKINEIIGDRDAWVNTPRRLMQWHQEIRSKLIKLTRNPISVEVTGGSWGLACNAIHYVDLVAWWTKSSIESVNCDKLNNWVPSKREGYYEVSGTIGITYTDKSRLNLCCDSSNDPITVKIATSQGNFEINEQSGHATTPEGFKIRGKVDYQSELTKTLVTDILQRGCCQLPSLAESTSQHRPLLEALLKDWNRKRSCNDKTIPIT